MPSNIPRTCFIKQSTNHWGPAHSFQYSEVTPQDILSHTYHKAGHPFELFMAFQADFYIIEPEVNSGWCSVTDEFLRDWVKGIIPSSEIDFSKYDLVITDDPILSQIASLKQQYPNTVFACWYAEHFLRHNLNIAEQYHLLLNHIGDSEAYGIYLPYPRCPTRLRELFSSVERKDNTIYIDNRYLTYLESGNTKNIVSQIKSSTGLEVLTNRQAWTTPDFFFCPPLQGDSIKYWSKLKKAKYHCCCKALNGQALLDGISIGCIGIGTQESAQHRLACHPDLLTSGNINVNNLINIINNLQSRPNDHLDILHHQDNALSTHFFQAHLSLFKKYSKKEWL